MVAEAIGPDAPGVLDSVRVTDGSVCAFREHDVALRARNTTATSFAFDERIPNVLGRRDEVRERISSTVWRDSILGRAATTSREHDP